MGLEIERKFRVRGARWREAAVREAAFVQAYLTQQGKSSIRVRTDGEQAYLNIKSVTPGRVRHEFQYAIPLADAEEILANLCEGPQIAKRRYWVPYGEHTWEIDVFEGDNAGLVVAEIELGEPDETFERPPWIGAEVTDELRYYDAALARRPYCEWTAAGRG